MDLAPAKAKSAFVPNDRKKLLGSIAALHMVVATFSKTPSFALTDQEAKVLTEALADVLDKHEINVTGGVSVEMTLIVTVLMIEGPRVKGLLAARKSAKQGIPEPGPVINGTAHSNFY